MEFCRPAVDLMAPGLAAVGRAVEAHFFEEGNGTIRITRPLTSHLATTAVLWRQPADEIAAWLVQRLKGECPNLPAALPLRRFDDEAKRHAICWRIGGIIEEPVPKTCRECGKALPSRRRKFCSDACAFSFHGGAEGDHANLGLAAMASGRARGLAPSRLKEANDERREQNRRADDALRSWRLDQIGRLKAMQCCGSGMSTR
jgi:hypothetical protein